MAIQWGLAGNSGGFQNALAQGYQMGSAIKERQANNALSAYMASSLPGSAQMPGESGIVATAEQEAESQRLWQDLVKRNPQAAYKIRQQEIVSERQQVEQQRNLLPQLAKLAEQATPENWMQVRQAAASLGIDLTQLPEQFDQSWLDQQKFVLNALGTPEGREAASNAGKIAQDMGFTPGTPEYNAKVAEIWNADQVKTVPYQAGGGVASVNTATGRVTPLVVPDYGTGNTSGSAAPPQISSPEQLQSLPPGTEYIAPDGTVRRKGGGVSNGTGGF